MKKINNTYKNIAVIFLCIIIFFISSFLLMMDRKYSFVENLFKNTSLYVNTYFLDSVYIRNNVSSNILTTKIESLEDENNNLREMLNLKENKFECINTEVINRNMMNYYSRFDINVGIKNNVSLKMPVINTEGLVGFISKIGNKVSEVSMLTNINNDNSIMVSIKTNKSRINGLLDGYNERKNLLRISNIKSNEEVKKDDKVVLSNYMNNDSYNDLYIGDVKIIKESNYGLTKTIYATPKVNFNNLLFLCVVK